MLDLSRKFSVAESDSESLMLAAAGESLLARGTHGRFPFILQPEKSG